MGERAERAKALVKKMNRRRIESFAEMTERELKDLEIGAKPLSGLVVNEEFFVVNALGRVVATSHTPESEICVGGISPVYQTGHLVETVLEVANLSKSIPVRKLIFAGYTQVRPGERIYAKIPRFEERTPNFFSDSYERRRVFYFPRGFLEEERAIEISVRNSSGVRIDRSVDYRDYLED